MSDRQQARAEVWRESRPLWVIAAVIVVVTAVVIVVSLVRQHSQEATRTDELYCTLSGVGPLNRGPETGRLCADLLRDVPGITWGS